MTAPLFPFPPRDGPPRHGAPRRGSLAPLLLAALLLSASGPLLAGCGSTTGPNARRMSFSNMQAINKGVDGDWILAEYPYARNVKRRSDGSLQSLGYLVDDPQGKSRPLMLHFDTTGTLVRKQYGGPIVRPPEPTSVDFGIRGRGPGSQAPRSHPDWTPAGYSQSGGK